MSVVLLVTYASVALFIVSVLVRFVRLSSLPIHLRWELYPVAHEKGRASYGGSYLEESDWRAKPRQPSHLGELKVMIPEILLLAGVWEHNRQHWFRSFPFHFGLYLLGGLIGLLLVGGIASAAGVNVSAEGGAAGKVLFHLTYVVGYLGLVLALVGALALLARRLNNPNYREYTKKADYFNLLLFIVTLGVGLAAHLLVDRYFAGLRTYFEHLVTFNGSSHTPDLIQPSFLMVSEIVLASLLLAYIPLTHMSHFFTKWFTYHHVRWNDKPNLGDSRIERQIHEVLKYPVSWSAPHIRGDGKKNWVDVATEDVEKENKE